MSNFDKEYDEFTEDMVQYFMNHQEYENGIKYLDKHPLKKIRFVSQLFEIWKSDRGRVDWYIANRMNSYMK